MPPSSAPAAAPGSSGGFGAVKLSSASSMSCPMDAWLLLKLAIEVAPVPRE